MKLTLAFLILAAASSAHAETAERGSRVVASVAAGFGPKSAAPKVTVREHAEDDGNLSLVIEGAHGMKLTNDNLISALERDEEDVSSYHVSTQVERGGGLRISSVKDWGSNLWSYGYTVAFRDGGYHLARFEYKVSSRTKHGTCSLDLASGGAIVNGHETSFSVATDKIDRVDGIELERICQSLGMN